MALLVAGLLAAYLAGNNRPALFDRDEPRYAVTSRAMLDTGDWVVPRFLGEVRTAKPPAVYWLQATAMRVVGINEFAVRLPGALACAGTVALLAIALPPLVGRRRAGWACFTLGTSVLVLGVAKVGVIDGILLLCVAVAQLALLRLLRRRGGDAANAVLLWTAVGVGGLLKGPVILGVLATTLIAWWMLNRRAPPRGSALRSDAAARLVTRTRPLLGLVVVALVCGPWLILIALREPGFLPTALGHDVAGRTVRGLEGHGQPPGFHLLALSATWFPWSVLLPATLVGAWRRRRSTTIRFALAACLGPWVMFELVATKLPHYLLPIFPMLALLTADWLVRVARGQGRLRPWEWVVAGALYAAVAVGFAAAPFVLHAGSTAAAGLAGLWGLATAVAWWRRRLPAAVLSAGVGMALVVAVAYLDWLPRAPMLTISRRVAGALADTGAREAIMVGYKEPSLGWYAGQRGIAVREADDEALASADGAAVTTRKSLARLAPGTADRWETTAVIPARLYNDDLRSDDILILRLRPPEATD